MRYLLLGLFAGCVMSLPFIFVRSNDVPHLVKQLGDDDFEKREAAQKELIAKGKESIPEVVKAAKEDKDPEIRSRARSIANSLGADVDKVDVAVLSSFAGKWLLVWQRTDGLSVPINRDNPVTVTVEGQRFNWLCPTVQQARGDLKPTGGFVEMHYDSGTVYSTTWEAKANELVIRYATTELRFERKK